MLTLQPKKRQGVLDKGCHYCIERLSCRSWKCGVGRGSTLNVHTHEVNVDDMQTHEAEELH